MSDPRDFFCKLSSRELAALRRVLLPGERICWGTRPVATFWQADTPGSLIFGGVALAIASLFIWGVQCGEPVGGEMSLGTCILLHAIALIFWLFGAGVASAPWWRWRRLRHTFYLITDGRALILSRPWWTWKLRAFELSEHLLLWRRVQPDGQGDLVFEAEDRLDRSGYVGFLHLPDAQLAERKLNEARQACRTS